MLLHYFSSGFHCSFQKIKDLWKHGFEEKGFVESDNTGRQWVS